MHVISTRNPQIWLTLLLKERIQPKNSKESAQEEILLQAREKKILFHPTLFKVLITIHPQNTH